MTRVAASYFDALYERTADPWNFAASPYERAKYEHTARILGGVGRLLEVGCSIGELTAVLAAQAEFVLAIDISARAVAIARTRLAAVAGVKVRRASFPEAMPAGDWDAIVCSEVLYYLDRDALDAAGARLAASLSGGARVLLVHWRLSAPSNPLQGDEVHDILCERLSRWHARDERCPRYRMDLLHA
ncbi:MAG: class I SAM-dependent methyltransferase [Solirubrobacteraceae bacterium]